MNPRPTQLSPAVALVQLLSENPSLPAMNWEIRPDGELYGRLWADDTRAVSAHLQQLLGIEHVLTAHYTHRDQLMVSEDMRTVWRDVPVRVSLRSLASAYEPALLAVTA